MKGVYIKWIKCAYENLDWHESSYFYAFTNGNRLLYIGMTYRQRVMDEIKRTLYDFDSGVDEVSIWLGYIASDFGRISLQIIQETESALIFANQPEWNTHHKSSYYARNNFKITSNGCDLFHKKILCVDDEMVSYREYSEK